MKSVLLAVVAVMAMAGCATGVEDPQPAPKVATAGNPAPPETFSADLDTSKPDPLLIDNGLNVDIGATEDIPSPPVEQDDKIDQFKQSDAIKFQAPSPHTCAQPGQSCCPRPDGYPGAQRASEQEGRSSSRGAAASCTQT